MEVHGIGLIEKLFVVACTLTDVMSCVPYEQYTFEYGPRDYLNQMMSLISTLRGGHQRYMPLLLSKINETMPSMPTPGYAIPAVPGGSRLEEMYDSSQGHSSAPTSGDSTPFESPSLGAVGPQGFDFSDMSMPPPPTSAGFPSVMTTGGQYHDLAVSAPTQIYQDQNVHAFAGTAGPSKYDIG